MLGLNEVKSRKRCYNIKAQGDVTKLVELHHHLSLSFGTTKVQAYNKS